MWCIYIDIDVNGLFTERKRRSDELWRWVVYWYTHSPFTRIDLTGFQNRLEFLSLTLNNTDTAAHDSQPKPREVFECCLLPRMNGVKYIF